MISSKDLTPDQVEAIKSWATAGDQLPDIQGKLLEEYSLNATYMDTRFLILDLGIELESEEEAEETESAETPASPLDPAAPAGGAVTVELDELTRPGAMVSGRIVFSDGEKAVWYIDQTGRPGLETDTPEYQPVEEDLIEFEKQLRALMAQEGGGEGA